MNKIDLVVWDWDGTIADSTRMIAQALIQAAKDAELPELSLVKARSVIGLGLRESIEVLFGSIPSVQAMRLAQAYQQYYHAVEDTILLYDGISDILAAIDKRGCKQAVATGKGRRGLDIALKNANLGKFFNATKTVDECFSKPHPQMLDELMDELVVMPEHTIMIGDSQYDLQMGKNAGVTTVAVTYGSLTATQLEGYSPDYMFHDVSSLRQWLLERI